ncbi:response regulator [Labilibaculum sp. K2S]|uniref:response regulator n=1 Tax=Labilibaculum sp. K2S TaxID=3056386 RepID=UPI0025A41199|nr:response regulator [Labilibaculum sp. K2S]MDM8159537.1 response regulator [Labilibaculum sp. K2S]
MRKILAIDDNNDNLVVYRAILKRYYPNCTIITCLSGSEGIEMAIKEQPDTILLDIIMPGMDGFETCEKLKQEAKTKHIPIILITAMRGDKKSRIKGLEIGADAFLSKPIEEEELIAQLNVMLRIKNAEDKLRKENAELGLDIKQKIEELEESKRKMITLLDNLPGFVYRCTNDRDREMEYLSEGCKEITGYTPKDFLEKKKINFNQIILPEYRESLWNKWQETLGRKEAFLAEYPIRNKNGEIHWIWERGRGVFDGDHLVSLEGFITDITKRKNAEKSNEINEEKFQKIFEGAPLGIALVNSNDGTFFRVNPKYCEITGYSKKQLSKIDWKSITHPDDIEQDLHQMKSLMTGEITNYTIEKRLIQPNGSYCWITLTVAKVDFETEGKSCHLAMIEDITQRKNLTEALITAKENAEKSDRIKSTFLASMSHELRTPLNAVIGFSELINENSNMEDILNFNDIINKSGNNLLALIEDLFDISLIETGDIRIENEPFSIQSMLDEVQFIIKNEQLILGKEEIELKMHADFGNIDPILNSDQNRIKQVLLNLLKNALKFTHSGSVEFGCHESIQNQIPMLKFYVTDSGIGIPPDKQELIFEVFRQVDESKTRIYGGTGLGLTICKRLINLLGGEIWVESEIEKGASFFFTIPDYVDDAKQIHTNGTNQQKLSLKGKTILIAEDDASSYSYLIEILGREGAKCIRAKNGREAVDYCKTIEKVDLLLMDINMPVMNGYEATKQIKNIKPELPVIAQTAYAMSGDREKILSIGCDLYLSKPVGKKTLLDAINKCFNKINQLTSAK